MTGLQSFASGQQTSTCLQGGISLLAQEQIDDFSISYPGCTRIAGNVTISGSTITNLDGLKYLKTIDGSLKISGANQLQSLAGLENLDSLYGNFMLNSNPALNSLEALASTSYIGGDVEIVNSPSLVNLKGISVDSIMGSLILQGDHSLTDLSGLESVTYIGRNFRLSSNHGFKNLSGALRLAKLAGTFTVENNINLTSFGKLPVDSIMGNVVIAYNSNLSDFMGLDSLRYIKGDLIVSRNSNMEDVRGLNELRMIGGNVEIGYNNAIKNISGLTSLMSVIGGFKLNGNNALVALDGLQSLRIISGDFILDANPALPLLPALKALHSIEGNMTISANIALLTLSGFGSLQYLGGNLSISNNPQLTSLDGLDSLATLKGSLLIFNNSSLYDLRGLNHVDSDLMTDIVIENSNALSDCEAISLCKYLEGNKHVEISNNAPGCNSVDEVSASCSMAADTSRRGNFVLYPDPEGEMVFVKGLISVNASVHLTNIHGKLIHHWDHPKNQLDFRYLPDGIYIVKIRQQDRFLIKRIVKDKKKITIAG